MALFKNDIPISQLLLASYQEDESFATELATEITGNPLIWFCPNLVQEKFINAITEAVSQSTIPIVMAQCGNGVGKTEVVLHTIANIILGANNGWYDNPWAKSYPFPKVAWYISTKQAIEGRVQEGLMQLFPEGSYKSYRGYKGYDYKYVFTNGWILKLFTTSQEPEEFESETVGLIVGDEPIPEPIWRAVKSRRRMGCLTLLPLTPLDTEPYLDEEIVSKHNTEGIRIIRGTIWEVTEDKERGHLPKRTAEEMVKGYAEDERAARESGEFTYFREIIYPMFDENIHVVSPEQYPMQDNHLLFQVVDPHDGRPPAVIWGFVTPEGRRVICGEYPDRYDMEYWDMTGALPIDEELRIYEFKESKFPARVHSRILDRHFGNQTRGANKKTLFDEYLDRGYYYEPSYSSDSSEGEIGYGHQVVRNMFATLPDGKPGLLIWNNCHHTIKGLKKYIRKRPRTGSDYQKGVLSGKIVEKFKNFPDCVRYFASHSLVPKTNKIKKKMKKHTNNPFLAI